MALGLQQISVRGLVMGPGTVYRWLTPTNPLNQSTRASGSGDRPWSHGGWAGAEWLSEKVVPIEFMIDAADELACLVAYDAALKAFQPVEDSGVEVEFRYRWADGERLLYGRPRGLEGNPELRHGGRMFCRGGFVALDPFRYSGDLIEFGPLTAPTWVGGLTFPVVFPVVFDSVLTGGEAVVTNAGTADAGMVLRIDGPCRTPSVQVESSSTTVALSIDLEIDTGEWIDIDTDAHTVVLNGTSNRRGDVFGVFPLIPPGDSTVRFRSEDESGSLTGSLRSKWW